MVATEFVRNVVGIIGNGISLVLFLSPLLTFVRIWKAKSVQEFKPDPYIATVLNCMMWVFYGLPIVHPGSILVLTINAIGLFIELTYVAIFFIYSPWRKRSKIALYLLIEVIFMAAVIFVTLCFFHTTKRRSMIIGILAIVFNVIMYSSPLTVMRRVITTKSVKYMPFYLSLFTFVNAIVWLIYALLRFDIYVLIPNALGSVAGAAQLILYATYYRTTRWDDDEPPRQVQLSDA